MHRSMKILGLALLGAFAMSTWAAPVAQSENTVPATFTAGVGANETAKGDGEQIGTGQFKIGSLPPMTCATAAGTGSALSVGPSFEEIKLQAWGETCHIVLLGSTKTITITSNGCYGVLAARTTESNNSFTAEGSMECPEGQQVEAHVYNTSSHNDTGASTLCTYAAGPQGPFSGGLLTNVNGSPDHVIAHGAISGIAVKRISGSGLVCGPENSTAVAEGTVTVRATSEDGTSVDATVSG